MPDYYQSSLGDDYKKSLETSNPNRTKGWIVGDFDRLGGLCRNSDIEIKYWKSKDSGESNEHPAKVQSKVWELTLVLEGKTKGFVQRGNAIETVELSKHQFIIIEPKTINNLVQETEEGTETLTIKFPSDPRDAIKLGEDLIRDLSKHINKATE